MSGDTTIRELRKVIDGIDESILNLINKRLEIAMAIGKIKEKKGEPIVDTVRENSLIEQLVRKNTGPISPQVLQEIFRHIITGSREVQNKNR